MARRAHDDGDAAAFDTDFQRLFTGSDIGQRRHVVRQTDAPHGHRMGGAITHRDGSTQALRLRGQSMPTRSRSSTTLESS